MAPVKIRLERMKNIFIHPKVLKGRIQDLYLIYSLSIKSQMCEGRKGFFKVS